MPPFALLPPPIDQYRCRPLRRDFTPVIDDFTQAATSHEPAGGKTLLSMTGASFASQNRYLYLSLSQKFHHLG